MTIKWIGAHKNNFGVGRDGKQVNKVILHWIVGSLESADATFAKSDRLASAHYGIGDNEIHQYVKEEDTAWHAGNLTVNKESIGIEHEGGPDLPVSEATIQTSIQLVTDLCRRYNIPADKDHIKRHSDIKATQCPGTLPVERIIEEVNKLLNPEVLPKWLVGLATESGIAEKDIEGWIRGLKDKAAQRDSAIKERDRANTERAAAEGRAAEFETLLQTATLNLKRTKDDLDNAKRDLNNCQSDLNACRIESASGAPPVTPQLQENWFIQLLRHWFGKR